MKTKYREIIREIWKIAFPMAFQALLMSGLQLIDSLFVSHLDSAEQVAAGVNAINNATFAVGSLITGFIAGIGIYFTQISSKQDVKKSQELFKTKIVWMVILSLVLITTLSIFLKPIASLWVSPKDNPQKTIDLAYSFGIIVIPSVVLDYFIVIFANSFKEIKKTKIPVLIALLALAMNAILNYVLMYVVRLGIRGSAYATLISRGFEIIVWIFYVWKTKPSFIPKLKELFIIPWEKVWKIFPKSMLWTLNSWLIALAFTIQIMFFGRISDQAGSSLNSAGVFLQLINAFTGGFSQAIGIMIVGSIARSDKIDIHDYIKKCMRISCVFGLICGIVIVSMSPLMFVIYSKYSHYANLQSIIMIGAVGATIAPNLTMGVMTTALKGSGFSKSLIFVDAAVSWLMSFPLTLLLVLIPNPLSYGVIYLCVKCVDFAKTPIISTYYNYNKNKIKMLEY